jgi:biopolymer transport protein ExbD
MMLSITSGRSASKKNSSPKKSTVCSKRSSTNRIVLCTSKAGAGVSYGNVVNVINEVRKLGVDKIGLVADKKKKDTT